MNQGTSGAEVRVATERSLGKDALGKDSGERIVYIKGNKAQRDSALEMIRSNPKVGAWVRVCVCRLDLYMRYFFIILLLFGIFIC